MHINVVLPDAATSHHIEAVFESFYVEDLCVIVTKIFFILLPLD